MRDIHEKLKPGQGNEIHITDAIKNLILKNEKFYGNIFKGKYLDCGTLNGYIKSGIEKMRNEISQLPEDPNIFVLSVLYIFH